MENELRGLEVHLGGGVGGPLRKLEINFKPYLISFSHFGCFLAIDVNKLKFSLSKCDAFKNPSIGSIAIAGCC